MVNTIIKLLKRNGLNKKIKNKHGLDPIEELETKPDVEQGVKDDIKKLLQS